METSAILSRYVLEKVDKRVSSLQVRQKWPKPKRDLQKNDIVLMIDKSQPRSSWLLARVLDVKRGRDGLVRSARIKTAMSEYMGNTYDQ